MLILIKDQYRSHPSRVRGLKFPVEADRFGPVLVSHPSRVRGLKLQDPAVGDNRFLSHPSRVRGLKCIFGREPRSCRGSHPSRVRGLKSVFYAPYVDSLSVAPFTGAWIEIRPKLISISRKSKSHPSRVRGLKSRAMIVFAYGPFVAPFTGAWIEILISELALF